MLFLLTLFYHLITGQDRCQHRERNRVLFLGQICFFLTKNKRNICLMTDTMIKVKIAPYTFSRISWQKRNKHHKKIH
jgi:hypothetical protein